ncbi:MAG: glycerate kinase [Phycisphaeraceae bacterium]
MKIVCAPDKFKGSLTADEAAKAMARGIRTVFPKATIEHCPVSDGGEGFVDALAASTGGEVGMVTVTGPLPTRHVTAPIALIDRHLDRGDWASVIEMSSASGLALVPPAQRDPTRTTTFGTGELLNAASACRRIFIGIGGSATTDGGCGMAQAMGVTFFDAKGTRITQPITGGSLHTIARIDTTLASLQEARTRDITVACDVTNPLTGPNGAAYIYGPQKGATPAQVKQLDEGLQHLARLVREQLGVDYEHTPGAGAAGGLGFGLMAFLGATLKPGIELVLDAIHFDTRLQHADLCLTGEGKLDGQSLAGKACIGVAKAAKKQGVPTIALVGAATADANQAVNEGLLHSYHCIGEGLPAEESMRRAGALLERKAAEVCRMFFDRLI